MRSTIAARTIIGTRRDGRPIYLIQGAEDGGNAGQGGSTGDGDRRDGGSGGGNGDGSGSGNTGAGNNGGQGGSAEQGGTGKQDGGKYAHLTDVGELRALAERLDREATEAGGKARQSTRDKAAADARAAVVAEFASKLGLTTDAKDPAALEAELGQYKTEATELRRELLVLRAAIAPGSTVDAGRLTDSRSFMARVATIDPTSDTAAEQITAAIKAAVASDQSLRARQGAAGGSVEHAGGAGDNTNPDLSKLHGTQLLTAAYGANSK